MRADWVGILESVYDVEPLDDDWKRGVARAALPCVPYADTVIAYSYDASDPAHFAYSKAITVGDEALGSRMMDQAMSMPMSPEYIGRTYRTLRAASVVETISLGAPLPSSTAYKAMTGVADVRIANGVDADGRGLWLGACLRDFTPLDDAERDILERVAAHLSVGWRLRRRLADATKNVQDTAEAVLAPDGAVKHAVGPAALDSARTALSGAVRAIDRARSKSHRADPARGLTEWRGMVARRWSLLEVFERDGKRFLVAQENTVPASTRVALTRREYEVAALAALGLSNKLVAYELGITASTTGVLLHRAMKKLGLVDRAGLRAKLAL